MPPKFGLSAVVVVDPSFFLYMLLFKTILQLRLTSQQYFEALRLRLGLPIINQEVIATQVRICAEFKKTNEEFHGLCTSEQKMERNGRVQIFYPIFRGSLQKSISDRHNDH